MSKRKPHTPRPPIHPAAGLRPPDDLPADPASFYAAGTDLTNLLQPPAVETKPALTRLGPPPFPRGGFPLLGFLSTLYDHLSKTAQEALHRPRTDTDAPSAAGTSRK
jgi:hypothetical protein